MIRVQWSAEDGQHVATSDAYPSLSWLEDTQDEALAGLRQLIRDIEQEAVMDETERQIRSDELRKVASRLRGEAHREPILERFARKFEEQADALTRQRAL